MNNLSSEAVTQLFLNCLLLSMLDGTPVRLIFLKIKWKCVVFINIQNGVHINLEPGEPNGDNEFSWIAHI